MMKKNGRCLMRTMVYLMLSVSALPPGYAQGIAYAHTNGHEKESLNNGLKTPLQKALKTLEKQHDVSIIYNVKAVENKTTSADLTASSAGVEESLLNILNPAGLEFERVNENVFVVVMPGETSSA